MRDQTIAKITSEQTLNTDEIDYVVNSIANEAKVSVSIEIKPTKFDKVKEVRTRTETTLYQVRRWRKDENDRLYITMWQDRGQAHESVMIDLVTGTVKTYRINNHHGAKYTPGTEAIMQALLPESSEQADTPTSHRITMTIHPDLYSVIADYAENNDIQSIGYAAAQVCGIGAETLEGRTVQVTTTSWGGVREGSGRPAADDADVVTIKISEWEPYLDPIARIEGVYTKTELEYDPEKQTAYISQEYQRNGTPSDVYHGRSVAVNARVYMEEKAWLSWIKDRESLFQRITGGHSLEWDGRNWRGSLTDDAQAAWDEIAQEFQDIDGLTVVDVEDHLAMLDAEEIEELIAADGWAQKEFDLALEGGYVIAGGVEKLEEFARNYEQANNE